MDKNMQNINLILIWGVTIEVNWNLYIKNI